MALHPVMPALTTRALAKDRKSTRLNSSHSQISYAVFCLKKKIRSCSPDPPPPKLTPNPQLPVEAYDSFVKRSVPRWSTSDVSIIRPYSPVVHRVDLCASL